VHFIDLIVMKESHNAQRIRLIGMFEGERCAAVVIGTPAVLLDISGPVFNSFILKNKNETVSADKVFNQFSLKPQNKY
jgi:hypothetical protein